MFKFFSQRQWYPWSILGSLFILVSTWYQVQLDVKINEWFGDFYDTLQKALTTPNSVSEAEFIGYLFTFAKIAGLWIVIAVFTGFFTSHWVFRWRTSMANYYHEQWIKARLTEGASQRVQEDTLKFARIMEGLGTGLLDSIMTLIAFTPILWGLSKQIDVLPWIGQVDHALVWVAIISALGGTLILAAVGIKLPGIEYDIQKEETSKKVKKKNDVNYFKILIVAFISVTALILVLDTFKIYISNIYPQINDILNSLYQSLYDIFLFFKDLIK